MMNPEKMLQDECKDRCKIHKDEVIKYYCEDHGQFGCAVCITLGHRSCNVGYIPTLAENLLESENYTNLKQSLERFSEKVKQCIGFAKENAEHSQRIAEMNIDEIKKLRRKASDFFEKLEKDAIEKALKNQSNNETTIEKLLEECNEFEGKIEKAKEDMNSKAAAGQTCSLFVDTTHLRGLVEDYDKKLNKLQTNNKLQLKSFIPSNRIQELISDESTEYGHFVGFVTGIRMRGEGKDRSKSFVITKHTLSAVDPENNRVMITDMAIDKGPWKTRKLKPSSKTCTVLGLIKFSNTEIAILSEEKLSPRLLSKVQYEQNLEIWSTKHEVIAKFQNAIKVRDLRLPIVYAKNAFIGFTDSSPRSIKIVNTEGKDIKTLKIELDEIAIDQPTYIAVNRDRTSLYFTDSITKSVICMDLEGEEVKSRFKPRDEWDPRDVAVSHDGTVYVCDCLQHDIFILTTELKEVGLIYGEMFGIKHPVRLAICDLEHRLYVGMLENSNMVVLQV